MMGIGTLERRQTWSHSLIEIGRDGGGYRMAYETESALYLPMDTGVGQTGVSVARLRQGHVHSSARVFAFMSASRGSP